MLTDHMAECLENCHGVEEKVIEVVTGMYGYSESVLSDILDFYAGYSDFEQLDQECLHGSENCPVYESLIESGAVTSYHRSCDTEVTFDGVTRGYFAVCTECEEDLKQNETYQD